MKKTLLSVTAVLAVITAASGVPSPADRKALCEKHPDKYVWVEKTEACVPINPCTSDNRDIVNAYCFPLEGTMESVDNGISVWDVIDFYIEYKNPSCSVAKSKTFNDGGKTFVPCIGDGYLVFELSGVDSFLVTDPLCWIGGYIARMPYDGWPTQCQNSSQDYCDLLAKKFADKTKIQYKENGTCVIGNWADEYYKGEIYMGGSSKVITNKTDKFGNPQE